MEQSAEDPGALDGPGRVQRIAGAWENGGVCFTNDLTA